MIEGDLVRIIKLAHHPRAKQKVSGYLVEHTRPDGRFAWMASFMADEVEAK